MTISILKYLLTIPCIFFNLLLSLPNNCPFIFLSSAVITTLSSFFSTLVLIGYIRFLTNFTISSLNSITRISFLNFSFKILILEPFLPIALPILPYLTTNTNLSSSRKQSFTSVWVNFSKKDI